MANTSAQHLFGDGSNANFIALSGDANDGVNRTVGR
jgi:hypothetical protein